MSEFKIGDRVRYVGEYRPVGLVGEVCGFDSDGDVVTRFTGWLEGHDGNLVSKSKEFYFCLPVNIELIGLAKSDDPYLDAATEAMLAAPEAGEPDDAWRLWYDEEPGEYERLIALAAAAIKRASEL